MTGAGAGVGAGARAGAGVVEGVGGRVSAGAAVSVVMIAAMGEGGVVGRAEGPFLTGGHEVSRCVVDS